ncbi:conjugal transfer mating pair stabilization protein TraG [Gammaproteobacteria bacterium]
MSIVPMYIISNGELAKEALNAVATLLSGNAFNTAMKIGVLFSIYGAAVNYIQGRDIATFAKWFVVYFGITAIMLTPKVTVQIFDVSNPGANYVVANIPYGLGYPTSIITRVAHGITEAFETAFHTPNDLSYNKTGMLFGSKLFRISSEFNAVNPEVRSELNEYVKNCVLGDILISKKYTMADLTNSTDLLETITKNTSNIRGIYIGEEFKTCQEAAGSLKKDLTTDAQTNLLNTLGKRLGLVKAKSQDAGRLLTVTYDTFFNYSKISKNALSIATQNVLINGIRDGLLNYTAETGATAALLNLSTAQAMDKMRMTLATSRNIALYTIPIIHTVLLLLMLSLFPIIILLALQPNLTTMVLKNYLYTLVWIESWPLMFSCLNMMVTFYAKELGPGGLTMSNIDKLLLEHSDIANMAGYLMLSVPFISGGLVRGMSSAFNHAASYIGGVLQSSSSSAASEAASGNIHLGNSSWNNINANKFDTNSTLMHGMATEQLGTGVLRTSRPEGKPIYDASHAISKLPANVRTSDIISESLSNQAETSRTASIQDLKTHDQSMSNAVSDFSSLGKTLSSGKSMTESLGSREAMSAGDSLIDMYGMAKNIAKNKHADVNDVLKGMVNFSQNAEISLGGSVSGKLPNFKAHGIDIGIGGDVSVRGKLSTEHSRIQESLTQHGIGRSINITAEEAQRFSNDLHKIEEYSKTHHADTTQSTAASELSQLSTDLRNSRSSLEQYSVHKADAERKAQMASYVRQHSSQIDSDMGQEIADYAVSRVGREEAEQLFAGKNRQKLESLTKEYIGHSGVESSIISMYQQDSAGINPEQKYQEGADEVDAKSKNINLEHGKNKQVIDANAKVEKVGVDEQGYEKFANEADTKSKEIAKNITDGKSAQSSRYKDMKNEVTEDIKDGSEKAEHSILARGSIKPSFADSDKNKK